MCEICSKLIIKSPERRQWRLNCYFLLYFTPCSGVSIINFEQVNGAWVECFSPSFLVECLKVFLKKKELNLLSPKGTPRYHIYLKLLDLSNDLNVLHI